MLAAAAESAQSQGDGLLGFMSRHALPGLLIALATAIVGFAAAGNIRAWQPKLAALNSHLQSLRSNANSALARAKPSSAQVKES
jgi:hypothetical protein